MQENNFTVAAPTLRITIFNNFKHLKSFVYICFKRQLDDATLILFKHYTF